MRTTPSIVVDFGNDSTLISSLEYFEDTQELDIYFKKYFVDRLTYVDVLYDYFIAFTEAKSKGRFYLNYIKNKLSQKTHVMAKRILKAKIDVTQINKDWLFTGAKGTYLNFTILEQEKADDYGNIGMIVQDVPTDVYKENKHKPKNEQPKGAILGNIADWTNKGTGGNEELKVGEETGKRGGAINDDLPF